MFGLQQMQTRAATNWRCAVCAATAAACLLWAAPASAVRIKDITTVYGVRTNHLVGWGLVVGLDGTGGKGPVTRQALLNFLQRSGLRADAATRLGIARDTQQVTENLAVVTVTADISTMVRKGQTVDVVVSALDAESLQGGELLDTALRGIDGNVYVMANGPIALGGFSAKGQAASVKTNHPTRGHVVAGGSVEREVPFKLGVGGCVKLLLRKPDFTTVHRIATVINKKFPGTARAIDAITVDIIVPLEYRLDNVGFISGLQELHVTPDNAAKVVIDENTGTIVAGKHVKIAQIAINHGNLTVVAAETPEVSQPNPFSRGVTAVAPRTDLQVTQERNPIAVIDETATVGDLAEALNALGASPRDLSTIFRQLYASGDIYAEVIFK